MKVIIIKSTPAIGLRGEIKNISDGYARNFLIPQGIALDASKKNVARLEAEANNVNQSLVQNKSQLKQLVHQLNGKVIKIASKVNKAGTLYGSIGPIEICQAIKEQFDYNLDPAVLGKIQHLKHLGEHQISCKVDQTEVNFKIIIQANNETSA